jgi:hypothetical protein
MRQLLQLLESALNEARSLKENHASQVLSLKANWEADLEREKAELIEAYELKLAILQGEIQSYKEDLEDYANSWAAAKDFQNEVQNHQVGVLPTTSLPQRLLFEKLEARWDVLNRADVEMIEAVLDGKVISI